MSGSALFDSKAGAFHVFGAVLMCIAIPVACSGAEVRITADRVNLRAGPSEQSEVVSQVSKGEILVVQGGLESEWLSVIPPARASLWIYGDLVKDGIVVALKAQVRAGPGISYKIVGSLQKGQSLTVRETTDDWLKIAPPPGSILWINRKYTEPVGAPKETAKPPVVTPPEPLPPGANAAKPQEDTPRAGLPRTGTVAHDSQAKPPVSTTDTIGTRQSPSDSDMLLESNLIRTMEQGKHVEYEGVLNYSSFVLKRPSKYVLVVLDDKGRVTDSCYVLGREAQFEALVGRQVRVSGKEYWVQGVRYSVVAPTRITLLPRR
jgi:uncharacterized protein YraI